MVATLDDFVDIESLAGELKPRSVVPRTSLCTHIGRALRTAFQATRYTFACDIQRFLCKLARAYGDPILFDRFGFNKYSEQSLPRFREYVDDMCENPYQAVLVQCYEEGIKHFPRIVRDYEAQNNCIIRSLRDFYPEAFENES